MRRFAVALALAAVSAAPVGAQTRGFVTEGYRLPANKPVTVVVVRPDIEVGSLGVGGLPEPNADWTKAARTNIDAGLAKELGKRGVKVTSLDAADAGPQVADYVALQRAVADAILTHKYGGAKLPTKRDRFDWTLGPGAATLGQASGANYALFLTAQNNYASAGRKVTQVAGALGCLVGFCMIQRGGFHRAHVALVDLATGNVVWFNRLRGTQGDPRDAEGGRSMVAALLATMPTKPGETVKLDEGR